MNLSGEHLTADDEHERLYGRQYEGAAPYCPGPGHVLDEDWVRLEDCPTCVGVRNHRTFRRPEGFES